MGGQKTQYFTFIYIQSLDVETVTRKAENILKNKQANKKPKPLENSSYSQADCLSPFLPTNHACIQLTSHYIFGISHCSRTARFFTQLFVSHTTKSCPQGEAIPPGQMKWSLIYRTGSKALLWKHKEYKHHLVVEKLLSETQLSAKILLRCVFSLLLRYSSAALPITVISSQLP